MWWLALALFSGAYGNLVNDPAGGPATSELVDGSVLLSALSEPRRDEVRCAVIANLVVHEVGRGLRKDAQGLTGEHAETLAGRLAETLAAEMGWTDEEVRAVYKADFEAFAHANRDNRGDAAADAAFVTDIAPCRPLYDSIDLSGKADGIVTGLTPIAGQDAAMPDLLQCHALLRALSAGMQPGSDTARAFADMTAQLAKRYRASRGDPAAASAELTVSADAFDGMAFEALPETEGERQISSCIKMAGE